MTKVIHSDFLTVAEAMTSAFSTVEKNQFWDLMPSLVPELAFVCECSRGNLIYLGWRWEIKIINK